MQLYSVIISREAWCAKNLLSGIERRGHFTDLPDNIANMLRTVLYKKTVCITTTIKVPNESEFNLWFNRV